MPSLSAHICLSVSFKLDLFAVDVLFLLIFASEIGVDKDGVGRESQALLPEGFQLIHLNALLSTSSCLFMSFCARLMGFWGCGFYKTSWCSHSLPTRLRLHGRNKKERQKEDRTAPF